MPYPNSQSPVTVALTRLFSNPAAIPDFNGTPAATALRDFGIAAGTLAANYGVAFGARGEAHINDWPLGQQHLVRLLLAAAIDENRRVSFDWQEAATFSVDAAAFGLDTDTPIGITFRSPQVY